MNTITGRNDAKSRHRFLVCSLGLMAMLMSTMSRIVLNISITSMVDVGPPGERDEAPSPGSCPAKRVMITKNTHIIDALDKELDYRLEYDGDLDVRYNFSQPSDSEALFDDLVEGIRGGNDVPNRYDWTIQQQSAILGGFYYSYFVFMIAGGRIAEVYGSKHVLMVAVSGTALIHLATPWLASKGMIYLTAGRVLMGAIQSGVYPAQYALFSKWLTMSEASIFTPMIKMNMKVGTLLGSLLPGLFEDWSHVFYLSGFMGSIWSVAWFLLTTSDPKDNRWVSDEEMKHIERKKSQEVAEVYQDSKERASISWIGLLTSPSVIGLAFAKLTLNFAIDFTSIEIPTYLKYVHNASKLTICTITTCMALIQIVADVLVGWSAKLVVKKRPLDLSRTCIRRIFQGIGNFGQFILYLLIASNTCDLAFVAVLFQLAGLTMTFSAGGDVMMPYELSNEYVATIAALSSSIANASSVAMTSLTGIIVGSQGRDYKRWNVVMMIVSLANLLGGLAFCSMVKAESIDNKLRKQTIPDKESGANPAV